MVQVVVPPLGESVTEATVGKWYKKIGDLVKIDEMLVEIETDKVTLEVNSPATGILSEIVADSGSNVKVSEVIGSISEASSSDIFIKANQEETKETLKVEKNSSINIPSPSAAKIASERDIRLDNVVGTGKDGRITKSDVIDLPKSQSTEPVQSSLMNFEHNKICKDRENRVKMSRLRQTIAQRLKDSQNTAAILTTFNEVDMHAVMQIRKIYQERFQKKHGVKLGFMSFFVKAVIQALKDIPAINAEIDKDTIVYKNFYDIGVAVGTDSGLVVPIVRDADTLSFAEIEKTIANLGQKAKDGKLSIADMTGGTFSITNGGTYGSMLSTPIINPPQSGILGMHNIVERPHVVNGQIVIRPIMYIALSYDHRIVDGKEAVTFLVKIKEMIENPERMLFDV